MVLGFESEALYGTCAGQMMNLFQAKCSTSAISHVRQASLLRSYRQTKPSAPEAGLGSWDNHRAGLLARPHEKQQKMWGTRILGRAVLMGARAVSSDLKHDLTHNVLVRVVSRKAASGALPQHS